MRTIALVGPLLRLTSTISRMVIAVLMMVSLIAGSALLAGCTIPDPDAPALPEPSVVCPTAPVVILNEEEQAREQQVKDYWAQVHQDQGWKILFTSKTCVGDIWDWLDSSTVPGSDVEPPPLPVFDLPPGIELQQTEFDLYPDLKGPANSVPKLRPSFAPYVLGTVPANSVEDFLAKEAHGRTDGEKRLYAGIKQAVANIGIGSFINSYNGFVEANTFSLMELAVLCKGSDISTTLEQVGVAASRDRWNFDAEKDDTKPAVTRLQVEFFTAGAENVGDYVGGWDGRRLGFFGRTGAPYGPGAALIPTSTVGGAYYDSLFQIQHYGGNWWVLHNHNWLGYYPGESFDLLGRPTACEVYWYAEVFDDTPDDWAATDMCSGQFSVEGISKAGYFRQPAYVDPAGVGQWPDASQPVGLNDPLCYSSSGVRNEGPLFERIVYTDGPGGDSPGCD
jgi:hypothetical protein